jgi:hypothetical protein
MSFWYLTFCHELAHNIHHNHDAKHVLLFHWYAYQYWEDFQTLSKTHCINVLAMVCRGKGSKNGRRKVEEVSNLGRRHKVGDSI